MSRIRNGTFNLTKGGGVEPLQSKTVLDWLITDVECTRKNDIKSFFKNYIYSTFFVLVLAFITYKIYLLVIITNKGKELNLNAWMLVEIAANLAFLSYLLLGLWTAFRLAYSDSDLYNNIANGSVESVMCHIKAVFQYSILTLVLFFWKTLLLSKILGGIIKISSRLVHPNSSIWNLITIPVILFILMLVFCLSLLLVSRLSPEIFRKIATVMKTSENGLSTIYLFSLTGVVTYLLLAGPIVAYVFLHNTEDVTVNCSPNELTLTGSTIQQTVNHANQVCDGRGEGSGGGGSGGGGSGGGGSGRGGGEGEGSGTTNTSTPAQVNTQIVNEDAQKNSDKDTQQASNNLQIVDQVTEEQCKRNVIRADYKAVPVIIGFMLGTIVYGVVLLGILKIKIEGQVNFRDQSFPNNFKIKFFYFINAALGGLIKTIDQIKLKTRNGNMEQLLYALKHTPKKIEK